jgi:hypothetical protein
MATDEGRWDCGHGEPDLAGRLQGESAVEAGESPSGREAAGSWPVGLGDPDESFQEVSWPVRVTYRSAPPGLEAED